MNENQILESKELREQLISRLDVLDKVKELICLPNTELITTKQVAEYYEVGEEVIRQLVVRNYDELVQNGLIVLAYRELTEKFGSDKMSRPIIKQYGINTGKNNIFSRRTVLNVGMLLRDSEVAKRVRTYLLDVEETVPQDVKVKNIDDETALIIGVVTANNKEELALAMNKYRQFMLRYKEQAEKLITENNALAKGILTWDSRQAINKMIRKLAVAKYHCNFALAWSKLYDEMLYKHNISIRKRLDSKGKNATMFDVLNEEEIKLAVKTTVALCKENGIDISDVKFE